MVRIVPTELRMTDEVMKGIVNRLRNSVAGDHRQQALDEKLAQYRAIQPQGLSDVEDMDIPNARMKEHWEKLVADGREAEAAEYWRKYARPKAWLKRNTAQCKPTMKIVIEPIAPTDPALDKLRDRKRKEYLEKTKRRL